MRLVPAALLGLLMLPAGAVAAAAADACPQPGSEIVTDRPDVTNSSQMVPKGSFQQENGVNMTEARTRPSNIFCIVIPGRCKASNPKSRRPRRTHCTLDSGFARRRAPPNDRTEHHEEPDGSRSALPAIRSPQTRLPKAVPTGETSMGTIRRNLLGGAGAGAVAATRAHSHAFGGWEPSERYPDPVAPRPERKRSCTHGDLRWPPRGSSQRHRPQPRRSAPKAAPW